MPSRGHRGLEGPEVEQSLVSLRNRGASMAAVPCRGRRRGWKVGRGWIAQRLWSRLWIELLRQYETTGGFEVERVP